MRDPSEVRKLKQTFLHSSIIQNKYNTETFVDFITKKKENGEDIDIWSQSELESVVDSFKRNPQMFFERDNFVNMENSFNRVRVSKDGPKVFKITVDELNRSVRRTYEDLEWTFNALSKITKFAFLPKLPIRYVFLNAAKTELSENRLGHLKVYVEYLFSFYFAIDTPVIKNFFNMNEESFQVFRKNPKNLQPLMNKFINNFTMEHFLKNLGSKDWKNVDFEISKSFPENIEIYIELIRNFTGKNNSIWKRTTERLQELEGVLFKASELMRGVSENMLELYSQTERLNSLFNAKDEDAKQLFLKTHKLFYNWGFLIRKGKRNAS